MRLECSRLRNFAGFSLSFSLCFHVCARVYTRLTRTCVNDPFRIDPDERFASGSSNRSLYLPPARFQRIFIFERQSLPLPAVPTVKGFGSESFSLLIPGPGKNPVAILVLKELCAILSNLKPHESVRNFLLLFAL